MCICHVQKNLTKIKAEDGDHVSYINKWMRLFPNRPECWDGQYYGGANDLRSASSVQSGNLVKALWDKQVSIKGVEAPINSTVNVRSIQAGWRERVNTEISAETWVGQECGGISSAGDGGAQRRCSSSSSTSGLHPFSSQTFYWHFCYPNSIHQF